MKRTLTLIGAALLLVALSTPLFAAGEQEGTAAEPQPLVWYVPGGSGYPYNETEEAAVYEAFNELVEADLGTTVEINVQGKFGEYNETMPLVLASGEYLDIVWTAVWSNDFLQNAYDGFYAGLDSLLEQYGQDILADTRAQLEATRINGEIRGVWSQQIAAYNTVFKTRMDLVDKYGWEPAEIDWLADLEPWLADVDANEPDLVPFGPGVEAWKLVQPYYRIANFGFLQSVVGVYADEDEIEVVNLVQTPEFREWCNLMHDWYQEGYIPQDGLTYTRDQWNQLGNQNKLALAHHNTYNPQNAELEIGGIINNTFRVGDPLTLTTNIINTIQSVSSQSEQQAKSVEFLNWLWTNQEAYNILVWGLEGSHYERVDESHIRPIQDSGYYTNIPWMWGNTFQSYLLPNQEDGLFEEVKMLNDTSLKANVLGFNPDVNELKTLIASISAVIDQYKVPLTGGYVDPDEGIAEFQAALDKAGLPDLIEMLQAQIDEWVEVNK
jgi:putative aldouronate transport system substrate-binding protein